MNHGDESSMKRSAPIVATADEAAPTTDFRPLVGPKRVTSPTSPAKTRGHSFRSIATKISGAPGRWPDANARMDVVITITNRVPLIAAGIRPETFISFCPSNYRRTFERGRGPSLVEILRAIPPLRGVGGRSQTIPLATLHRSPP